VTPAVKAFGPDARLRSRVEYTTVQERGRRVAMRYVILLGCPNNRTRDRLGIIASRRLGGAVVRNRAKRRLRALFRQSLAADDRRAAQFFDVVAIPRRELATAPWPVLEQEFRVGLARLRAAR